MVCEVVAGTLHFASEAGVCIGMEKMGEFALAAVRRRGV